MSRAFGWDLPPGVTGRDLDALCVDDDAVAADGQEPDEPDPDELPDELEPFSPCEPRVGSAEDNAGQDIPDIDVDEDRWKYDF